MQSSFAVLGSSYGDEAKGLIVDWLCATHGADLVVRFNGGAQAGHTVVTPSGERHVFSHFGAGTLAGAATWLSRFFICNPILFTRERHRLGDLREPQVFVDSRCPVTVPFDMLICQWLENSRGASRHGSCGIGINETVIRCQDPRYALTVRDLIETRRGQTDLSNRLEILRSEYLPKRLAELGLKCGLSNVDLDIQTTRFLIDARTFMRSVRVTDIMPPHHCVVFEGAQGLLLDEDNKDAFPHVTRSHTGLRNVLQLCDEAEIRALHAHYVTRCYLTRHGAGPLPNEGPPPFSGIVDETNVTHPWQGSLRYAPLDVEALQARIQADLDLARGRPIDATLCVTCLDHVGRGEQAPAIAVAGMQHVYSAGPTRRDVSTHFRDLHSIARAA